MASGNAPKRQSKSRPTRPSARPSDPVADLRSELDAAQQHLREAAEREAAISEILRAISSSPTDVQPVLDAIAEHAVRYCNAEDAVVSLLESGALAAKAHVGPVPNMPRSHLAVDRDTVTGHAFVDRRTIHVADQQNDPDHPVAREVAVHTTGHRTALGTPLLRQGEPIGVILLRRRVVQPFTPQQVKLVEAFATQAVIAIENVRLFHETREALERQTAMSDVLTEMSRSAFDIGPVLQTVLDRAHRLSEADHGWLIRDVGDRHRLEAYRGNSDVMQGMLRDTDRDIVPRGWTKKAIAERRTQRVDDLTRQYTQFPLAPDEVAAVELRRRTHPEDPPPSSFSDITGAKKLLVVPLVRSETVLGVIVLTRTREEQFSARQVDIVETFAQQAAIAIENVRLFNETKEALERQTAISEILRIISASPTNVRPVLEAIAENALRFCAAEDALVVLPDGDDLRLAAHRGPVPVASDLRYPNDGTSMTSRAFIEARTIAVQDLQTSAEFPRGAEHARAVGHHAVVVAPLLRDGMSIGTINLRRFDTRPFSDREVAALETFAAQAVIAIENVRLFNEIQEKSAQLAAASRHKSEFLANMSHELRTPLNAIIGFSDVLEQRMYGTLNDQQSEYIRDIAGSGRHLLDLVNEILDLSKVEAGRMELEPTEFALADTIRGALAFVRERAATHAIELAADVHSDLGTVVADERKVRQVLLNLLSNAVKFTPDGGTIGVQAQRGDGQIQVSVRDTGIGIALADQAKVFDEFQQVGKASDRSREGTGLGLTLAKRFIELHGGRIWVTSELGKGTTFTFAIPVERPATVVVR